MFTDKEGAFYKDKRVDPSSGYNSYKHLCTYNRDPKYMK